MAWFTWFVVLELTSLFLKASNWPVAEGVPRISPHQTSTTHKSKRLLSSEDEDGRGIGSGEQDSMISLQNLKDFWSITSGTDDDEVIGSEDEKSGKELLEWNKDFWDEREKGEKKKEFIDDTSSDEFPLSGSAAIPVDAVSQDWSEHGSHQKMNKTGLKGTSIAFNVKEESGSSLQDKKELTSILNSESVRNDDETGSREGYGGLQNLRNFWSIASEIDNDEASGSEDEKSGKHPLEWNQDFWDVNLGEEKMEHVDDISSDDLPLSGSATIPVDAVSQDWSEHGSHRRIDKAGLKENRAALNVKEESGSGLQDRKELKLIVNSESVRKDHENGSREGHRGLGNLRNFWSITSGINDDEASNSENGKSGKHHLEWNQDLWDVNSGEEKMENVDDISSDDLPSSGSATIPEDAVSKDWSERGSHRRINKTGLKENRAAFNVKEESGSGLQDRKELKLIVNSESVRKDYENGSREDHRGLRNLRNFWSITSGINDDEANNTENEKRGKHHLEWNQDFWDVNLGEEKMEHADDISSDDLPLSGSATIPEDVVSQDWSEHGSHRRINKTGLKENRAAFNVKEESGSGLQDRKELKSISNRESVRKDYGSGSRGHSGLQNLRNFWSIALGIDDDEASGSKDKKRRKQLLEWNQDFWDVNLGVEKKKHADDISSDEYPLSGSAAIPVDVVSQTWNEQKSYQEINNTGINGTSKVLNTEEESGSDLHHRKQLKLIVSSKSGRKDYESGSHEGESGINFETTDTTSGDSSSELPQNNKNNSVRIHLNLHEASLVRQSNLVDNVTLNQIQGESGSGELYDNEDSSTKKQVDKKKDFKVAALGSKPLVNNGSGSKGYHLEEQKLIAHSGLNTLDNQSESVIYSKPRKVGTNDLVDSESGSGLEDLKKTSYRERLFSEKTHLKTNANNEKFEYSKTLNENEKQERKESEKSEQLGQLRFDDDGNDSTDDDDEPSIFDDSTEGESGSGQQHWMKSEVENYKRLENSTRKKSVAILPLHKGKPLKVNDSARHKIKKNIKELKKDFKLHHRSTKNYDNQKAIKKQTHFQDWLQFLSENLEKVESKPRNGGKSISWPKSGEKPASRFLSLLSVSQSTEKVRKGNKYTNLHNKTKTNSSYSTPNHNTVSLHRKSKNKSNSTLFSRKNNLSKKEGKFDKSFKNKKGRVHNSEHYPKDFYNSSMSEILNLVAGIGKITNEKASGIHRDHRINTRLKQSHTSLHIKRLHHKHKQKQKHRRGRIKHTFAKKHAKHKTKTKLKTHFTPAKRKKKLTAKVTGQKLSHRKSTNRGLTKKHLPRVKTSKKDQNKKINVISDQQSIESLNLMIGKELIGLRHLLQNDKKPKNRSKTLKIHSKSKSGKNLRKIPKPMDGKSKAKRLKHKLSKLPTLAFLNDIMSYKPRQSKNIGKSMAVQESKGVFTPARVDAGLSTPAQVNTGVYNPALENTGLPATAQVNTRVFTPAQVNTGVSTPAQVNSGVFTPVRENTGVSTPVQVNSAVFSPPQSPQWPVQSYLTDFSTNQVGQVSASAASAVNNQEPSISHRVSQIYPAVYTNSQPPSINAATMYKPLPNQQQETPLGPVSAVMGYAPNNQEATQETGDSNFTINGLTDSRQPFEGYRVSPGVQQYSVDQQQNIPSKPAASIDQFSAYTNRLNASEPTYKQPAVTYANSRGAYNLLPTQKKQSPNQNAYPSFQTDSKTPLVLPNASVNKPATSLMPQSGETDTLASKVMHGLLKSEPNISPFYSTSLPNTIHAANRFIASPFADNIAKISPINHKEPFSLKTTSTLSNHPEGPLRYSPKEISSTDPESLDAAQYKPKISSNSQQTIYSSSPGNSVYPNDAFSSSSYQSHLPTLGQKLSQKPSALNANSQYLKPSGITDNKSFANSSWDSDSEKMPHPQGKNFPVSTERKHQPSLKTTNTATSSRYDNEVLNQKHIAKTLKEHRMFATIPSESTLGRAVKNKNLFNPAPSRFPSNKVYKGHRTVPTDIGFPRPSLVNYRENSLVSPTTNHRYFEFFTSGKFTTRVPFLVAKKPSQDLGPPQDTHAKVTAKVPFVTGKKPFQEDLGPPHDTHATVTTKVPLFAGKKPTQDLGPPKDALAKKLEEMSSSSKPENGILSKAAITNQTKQKTKIGSVLPILRLIAERTGKKNNHKSFQQIRVSTDNDMHSITTSISGSDTSGYGISSKGISGNAIERHLNNKTKQSQSLQQLKNFSVLKTHRKQVTTSKPTLVDVFASLQGSESTLNPLKNKTKKMISTPVPTLTAVSMIRDSTMSATLASTSGEADDQLFGYYGDTQGDTAEKCDSIGKSGFVKDCPPGWIIFREYCFKFVDDAHGPWNETPPYCADSDAKLAMPKTNDAQKFLKTFLANHDKLGQRYFVGLKKMNGKWKWNDDTPLLKDTQSSATEDSAEGCGVMEDGQIRGTSCSQSLGYICEMNTGMEVIRVLALGDSLTQGYYHRGKEHHPYTKKLEYLLNKDSHKCFVVDNIGKERNLAGDMARRLGEYLTSVREHYGWIVILGGTNDIVHRSHEREVWDDIANDVIRTHRVAHNYGARTLVVTIPEEYCGEEGNPDCAIRRKERAYINDQLRRYAMDSNMTVLCDAAAKMPRINRTSSEEKFYWEKGLHLTPQGYDRLSEVVYKDLLWGIEE